MFNKVEIEFGAMENKQEAKIAEFRGAERQMNGSTDFSERPK